MILAVLPQFCTEQATTSFTLNVPTPVAKAEIAPQMSGKSPSSRLSHNRKNKSEVKAYISAGALVYKCDHDMRTRSRLDLYNIAHPRLLTKNMTPSI